MKTLGLDVGVASVGSAVVTEDDILGIYVRTFNEPLPKSDWRANKSARRTIRRKAFRLKKLMNYMAKLGLISNNEPNQFVNMKPLNIKVKALTSLITPKELACALYHSLNHRGYLSTSKSEESSSSKVSKDGTLAGVSSTLSIFNDKNYASISDMLLRDDKFKSQKRNKSGVYTHTLPRKLLIEEIKLIFSKQRSLENQNASKELEDYIINAMLQRRPALSGDAILDKVGFCPIFTTEKRAAKAGYTSELFVLLGNLNNLRIKSASSERSLTDEEKQLIIDSIYAKNKAFSYKDIRKVLVLPEDCFFNLSKSKDEKSKFFHAKCFHEIAACFSKDPSADLIDDIGHILSVYKEDNEKEKALIDLNIHQEAIEELLKLDYMGFMGHSLSLLKMITPKMKQGMTFDAAVDSLNIRSESQSKKGRYIPRNPVELNDLSNPVVKKSIQQAILVINALSKKYGRFDAVHIELARDISKPEDERGRIERANNERYAKKQEALKMLAKEYGVENPNSKTLAKFNLYKEQQGKCAYSFEDLDLDRVLNDNSYTEIDHAIPWSRSYDDGMSNKVLCLTRENQNKGNRTPFEYFGSNEDSVNWIRFCELYRNNRSKQQKICKKEIDSNEFLNRQLNDTRYATKLLKSIIEKYLDFGHSEKSTCVTATGQLTSLLRSRWGLNKVRSDSDTHHGMDAVVVAYASRSMIQKAAQYNKRKETHLIRNRYIDPETGEILNVELFDQINKHFPNPFSGFRELVLQKLESVFVSRPERKMTNGELHNATIYSSKKLQDDGVIESRIALNSKSFTRDKIQLIKGFDDPRNSEFIQALYKAFDESKEKTGDKVFKKPFYKPVSANSAQLVKKITLIEKAKASSLNELRGGVVSNGSQARTDVFTKDGKYYLVVCFAKDIGKKELPISISGSDDVIDDSYRFLFSLHPDALIEIEDKEGVRMGYFAGSDIASGGIVFYNHNLRDSKKKIRKGSRNLKSFKKLKVDALGKVSDAGFEVRKMVGE